MFRSILQIYVKGKDEALEFYMDAFGAGIGFQDFDDVGNVIHTELDVNGQAIAVGEAMEATRAEGEQRITGNAMQFCIQFGEGLEKRVEKAYAVLSAGGEIVTGFGDLVFTDCGFELIDKYGVWWCVFA